MQEIQKYIKSFVDKFALGPLLRLSTKVKKNKTKSKKVIKIKKAPLLCLSTKVDMCVCIYISYRYTHAHLLNTHTHSLSHTHTHTHMQVDMVTPDGTGWKVTVTGPKGSETLPFDYVVVCQGMYSTTPNLEMLNTYKPGTEPFIFLFFLS